MDEEGIWDGKRSSKQVYPLLQGNGDFGALSRTAFQWMGGLDRLCGIIRSGLFFDL